MKSQSLWSSTPAWRLPICKAPSPTSAWRLSIYKGALTSPCARQFIIPTRGSVCPPTSKVAISSLSGVSKETWLSLISPLEMPDDARFASRSAQRRRSFPSTSNSKFSYLLFHPTTDIHITVVSSSAVMTSRCSFVRADAYLRRPLRHAHSSVLSVLPRHASRCENPMSGDRGREVVSRGVDSTTYMQIDARRTSTSSARVNTTTSCTAVVSGASSAGLLAPCLACNAMFTGTRDST